MKFNITPQERGVVGVTLFILLMSLVAVLLFGCKPAPERPVDDGFTLLRPEIFAHMRESGFEPWSDSEVVDSEYALPTEEWVQTQFAPKFRKVCSEWGLTPWRGNKDCDDASGVARLYAQVVYWEAGGEHSLAFGWFDFILESGEYHSANFILVLDSTAPNQATLDMRNPAVRVLFWEPQTREFFELSDVERRSIVRYRI